jgi:outer membrane protein assembly factor BamB
VPTIFNNAIYFASLDGNLFSLDINTGRKNWAYMAQGSIWGSPSVVTKEGKVIRGFGNIDESK